MDRGSYGGNVNLVGIEALETLGLFLFPLVGKECGSVRHGVRVQLLLHTHTQRERERDGQYCK